MKRSTLVFFTTIVVAFAVGCSKQASQPAPQAATTSHHSAARAVYSGFPETFESGSKTAYAAAAVTLSTGSWYLNDALIGTSSSDHKDGSKCVRIENTGKVTMQFDVTNGASQVSIANAEYGSDASSTWQLWYSTDGGSTWTETGTTQTTSSTSLTTTTFTMSISGNVRFELRKLSGGRLNIDDFSITDNSGSGGGGGTGGGATRDDNMAMGNPSGAVTSTSYPNNYLLVRAQYAMSYNSSKGIPNWVSWHLSTAWLGSATRCNCFSVDPSLPTSFFRASTSNYTGTGFDRGHLCPSDDRTASDSDNSHTFYMSNITPQSPHLNEITWEALESYCRSLVNDSGYELYIIAGGYGSGGTGSSGSASTIDGGAITVPSHFYKIIVVLPIGTGDAGRVSTSTRVIAVDMPNNTTVNSHTWDYYRTSVDAIETSTGYDFLSNVSTSVQSVIEARVDNVTIP